MPTTPILPTLLKKTGPVFLACLFCVGFGAISGARAYADDSPDACNGPDCHHYRSRFSVSFVPSWYHVTRDNYASAFTQNGFNSPSSDRFGLGILLYWTTPTDWQLGFGFSNFSITQDVGSSEASYQDSTFGFYAAKNLTPGTDWDLTVGGLIGVNASQVEVFSANQNGKFTEGAPVLEPAIGAAYRIASFVKLGFMGSYLFPFAESTDSKGQDLGVNKISARGFALGAQVILGRFDLVEIKERN